MALQKSITLPNGATGNYIRLGPYFVDPLVKEASAQLMLHTNAAYAASAPEMPLCMIAKLRLQGAKFDEYLANSVLNVDGVTLAGKLYEAAKAEPIIAGGGLTQAQLDLSDAADV